MSRQRAIGTEISQAIGRNVAKHRKAMDLSRQGLSDLIAQEQDVLISPTVIRHMENAISEGDQPRRVRVVAADELWILSLVFGVSMEELTR